MTCASSSATSSRRSPSFANSTSSPAPAEASPARTRPFATTASALWLAGSATGSRPPATSRASSIVMGVKVRAGPLRAGVLAGDDADIAAAVERHGRGSAAAVIGW